MSPWLGLSRYEWVCLIRISAHFASLSWIKFLLNSTLDACNKLCMAFVSWVFFGSLQAFVKLQVFPLFSKILGDGLPILKIALKLIKHLNRKIPLGHL